MSDIIAYLKATKEKVGDQFELEQLKAGDELRVATQHTDYVFAMLHARVKLMGCTFGQSSSIKPDYLFCGGNLEFTYELDGVPMTHKTTAIRAIYLRRTQTAA
jgi:hypothetical protein